MGVAGLEALLALLGAVGRARSLRELGEALLHFARACVPQAQAGSVLLLNEFTGRYEFVASLGWDLSKLHLVRFPKEKILQHSLYGDRPAIIRNIAELSRNVLDQEFAEKLGEVGPVAVTLTVPLWAEGKLIGYVNLDHHHDPEAFSEADLEKLRPYYDLFANLLQRGLERQNLRETADLFRLLFERLADAVYITSFDGTILEANPAAERQTGYSRAELLGKNIMRDIAAGEPAITYEKVNELLAQGETVVFEEKKRRKDGSFYWTECAVVQFTYKGQLATLSVNRDITERKRLEEELARRVEELSALNRALGTVTSQLERRKVVQALVDLARELSGAEYANILVFDEDGKVLESIDPLGSPPLPLRLRPRGFTRFILESGEPLLLRDIRPDGSTDPVVEDADGQVILANPVLVEQGIRSLAGFPLLIGGKPRGVFFVHSRQAKALDQSFPILSILAGHASIALENAELYEQLAESQAFYRTLFEESPLSLWLEDFSEIKKRLSALRQAGITDLRAYLLAHPEFLREVLELLRVVHVNRTTLELYGVKDKAELQEHFPVLISEEAFPLLTEELLAIGEGRLRFRGRGVNRTRTGKTLHIDLSWRVLPGYEEDYSRVLVSVLDVTAQVEAEEVLRRVNQALTTISSSLDLPQVLRLIASEIKNFIPHDAFFVALVEKKRGKIKPVLALEEGQELSLPELPLDPAESTTAWVAIKGEPLFLEDVERTPPPVPFKQVGRAVRAWAGIPLFAQGEPIGVLSVQSFQTLRFGERERHGLLALASGIATILRNAVLHAEVQDTGEKLRRIEEVSRHLKLAQKKEELYEIVLDAISQILSFKYAAILVPEGGALVIAAHRGYPPELQNRRFPLSEGEGVTVAAFLANQTLYLPDVREDPRYVKGLPTFGCELAVPISVGEKVFGVLNVEHDEIDGISPRDRDLIEILAGEVAVALLSLSREERLREFGEKLAALHQLSYRLQRCETLEEVCRTAAEGVVESLGFPYAVIGLRREDWLVPVAEAGLFAGKAQPFRVGEGLAGKTLADGRTYWGPVQSFPEVELRDPRFAALISVPVGDRGVLQVVETKPDAFEEEHVILMEILARHIAEELRRVELEEELREQAIRDPVTGLYNRRFLDEVLRREVARAERYGHALSLILVDIDNFKEINDRYGHLVGDEALRRVARALQENIRRVDYIFRWGGDEFCVILPETNGLGAKEVVRRFQEPFGILAEEPMIRLTLGYTSWDPRQEPAPSVEELFRRADQLLYQMKRAKPSR
ncbi:MAG: GAF domain-containing protein [Candidatus Bipolaricaulaceae bacterium]